jgi:hypothetical protein
LCLDEGKAPSIGWQPKDKQLQVDGNSPLKSFSN